MRVVFDTNIFISAFVIPGGKAEKAFLHVVKGDFILFTSIAILTEIAGKLKVKFSWSEEKIAKLLKLISKVAKIVKTSSSIHLLSDEPDNRILECAGKVGANFIVTGDKHLLKLESYKNIKIVKLADFICLIEKESEKNSIPLSARAVIEVIEEKE